MSFPITPKLELISELANHDQGQGKVVLLVLDGLGGIGNGPGGKTELETAATPNLDHLADSGSLAQHDPIGPGFTPGSGIAHLSLFGHDPHVYEIGRGILANFGARCFEPDVMKPGEVAARINFCTVEENADGLILTDRRAGRIGDAIGVELVELLNRSVKIDGVDLKFFHSKEYRAVLHLRGQGWSGSLIDTDPQQTGVAPKTPAPTPDAADDPAAKKTAEVIAEVLRQARAALKDRHPANFILTRGFDTYRPLPDFPAITGMKSVAIAAYPDYRGVGRLLHMDVAATVEDIANRDRPADDKLEISVESEFDTLEKVWDDYDFFFVHIKKTDSYGEDGNFAAKVKVIEQVDALVPRLQALRPAAICVTGDHCTPTAMKAHSFHPVPVLFWGDTVLRDENATFGERACMKGGHGRIHGTDLLPLMMAYAGRLNKRGA
jgi:2,3-bisphosphoglycerate-independent phosphoglycerate mutase